MTGLRVPGTTATIGRCRARPTAGCATFSRRAKTTPLPRSRSAPSGRPSCVTFGPSCATRTTPRTRSRTGQRACGTGCPAFTGSRRCRRGLIDSLTMLRSASGTRRGAVTAGDSRRARLHASRRRSAPQRGPGGAGIILRQREALTLEEQTSTSASIRGSPGKRSPRCSVERVIGPTPAPSRNGSSGLKARLGERLKREGVHE